MAKYNIEGSEVDTERASESWGDRLNDGSNVSKYTGSATHRATLYRTRRGRYFLEHRSPDETAWAEWLSPERAAQFLTCNNYHLTDVLKRYSIRAKYIMPLDEIEIAQHLADWVTDYCKNCPVWLGSEPIPGPGSCIDDSHITCLKRDEPGEYNNHNYSVNKDYKPTDYRHWGVCKRLTEDELAEELRGNA
jgi:hypothetical protein